jgi:hypothetical protein
MYSWTHSLSWSFWNPRGGAWVSWSLCAMACSRLSVFAPMTKFGVVTDIISLLYIDWKPEPVNSDPQDTYRTKKQVPHYMLWSAWWERRYSSYSFSTSSLDGGEWSVSCLGRTLAPGKRPQIPIVQEAGWVSELVWTQRLQDKSFHLCRGSDLNRPVVQPIARQYTDWATRLLRTVHLSKLSKEHKWCKSSLCNFLQ